MMMMLVMTVTTGIMAFFKTVVLIFGHELKSSGKFQKLPGFHPKDLYLNGLGSSVGHGTI